jgi:GNAT superfamily N-acetyltransferase
LYRKTGYSGTVSPDDLVLVAVAQNQIIGAVRLCQEFGTTVLRGMYILKEFQRKGIGTLLLRASEKHLTKCTCYCIPYRHLETFYGQCAFKKIDVLKAPGGMAKRLEEYTSKGLDVILMQRSGHT